MHKINTVLLCRHLRCHRLHLTKIVLVGDNTPQNCSCGRWRTTKLFLRGSSTTTNTFLWREEGKHEMQMRCKWKCKRGKYFSSFSYELGEKQEQGEQRKKELWVKLVELGRGSAMGSLCTISYRGAPPLSRPTKGSAGLWLAPISSFFFQWFIMTATWSKNAWVSAEIGRCRPRSCPQMHLDM